MAFDTHSLGSSMNGSSVGTLEPAARSGREADSPSHADTASAGWTGSAGPQTAATASAAASVMSHWSTQDAASTTGGEQGSTSGLSPDVNSQPTRSSPATLETLCTRDVAPQPASAGWSNVDPGWAPFGKSDHPQSKLGASATDKAAGKSASDAADDELETPEDPGGTSVAGDGAPSGCGGGGGGGGAPGDASGSAEASGSDHGAQSAPAMTQDQPALTEARGEVPAGPATTPALLPPTSGASPVAHSNSAGDAASPGLAAGPHQQALDPPASNTAAPSSERASSPRPGQAEEKHLETAHAPADKSHPPVHAPLSTAPIGESQSAARAGQAEVSPSAGPVHKALPPASTQPHPTQSTRHAEAVTPASPSSQLPQKQTAPAHEQTAAKTTATPGAVDKGPASSGRTEEPSVSPGAAPQGKASTTTGNGLADQGGQAHAQGTSGRASSTGSKGGSAGAHSPEADPGFQAVKSQSRALANSQSEHAPAGTKATEAEAAAASPAGELQSEAEANHLGVLEQAQAKPFGRAAFKAALLSRIAQSVPTTLKEADQFKSSSGLANVKSGLQQQVTQGKQEAELDLKQKVGQSPSTAGIAPRVPRSLTLDAKGGRAPGISAAQAAPKPRTEAEVSIQEGPRALERQLAEAKVTEPQLNKSNESQFQAAASAKQQLATNAQQAPGTYRQTEQSTLAQAQAHAEGTAQAQTQGMQGHRLQAAGQVMGQQSLAKSKNEQARAQVTAHIQQIFQATKQRVEQRLARIDDAVNQVFDQGAATAKDAFEGYVDARMRAYKEERYSGVLGAGRWIKDQFLGLPAEVNGFYQEGKQRYLTQMDGVLDRIALTVETGLSEAKAEVGRGKQEVSKYVASLPTALKQVGQDAQQQIQSQFDSLEQSIRDKHEQLIDSLAQKYCENVKQLDERIGELKTQNQGLVDKAKALVTEVIQTIKQLRDMLLGVLARAAAVIDKILADPIGFVGNLVAGAKAGFQKFVGNIGKHLQTGLIGWLTGQLGSAGITLPESFDLKGIFSLVTQVLGLTWQNIRARAVKILGEKAVKVLETASDLVQVLISGGPAALWEHVQGMVGDLKAAVLDQLKEFVITQIIQAGVTWVLSLLNPASAFIKACKAIYDVIMFFIERAAQIADLVNAVLDSVEAVASGNVSAMADRIEGALVKALPVAIGFLASLLGLGGITEKIKNILQKVRAPIEKAIDAVLKKAVGLVKKAGKWISDKATGNKPEAKGNEPSTPKPTPADVDDEQSLKVKAKARLEMTRRTAQPLKDQAQLQHIIAEVLTLLRPEGLKSLFAQPKAGQQNKFEIIATASPAEKVDEAEIKLDSGSLKQKFEEIKQSYNTQEERITQLQSAARCWEVRANEEADTTKQTAMRDKSKKAMQDYQILQQRHIDSKNKLSSEESLLEIATSDSDRAHMNDVLKQETQIVIKLAKDVIRALAEIAEYIPAKDYSNGKHSRGKDDNSRRENSIGSKPGQYYAESTASQQAAIEKETLQNGDCSDLLSSTGTVHVYHSHRDYIGYANGEDTKYHRAELAGLGAGIPVVHGHPRPKK